MHNVSNVVYTKNLRIRGGRSNRTMQTQIRLLLKEQSDRGLLALSLDLLL